MEKGNDEKSDSDDSPPKQDKNKPKETRKQDSTSKPEIQGHVATKEEAEESVLENEETLKANRTIPENSDANAVGAAEASHETQIEKRRDFLSSNNIVQEGVAADEVTNEGKRQSNVEIESISSKFNGSTTRDAIIEEHPPKNITEKESSPQVIVEKERLAENASRKESPQYKEKMESESIPEENQEKMESIPGKDQESENISEKNKERVESILGINVRRVSVLGNEQRRGSIIPANDGRRRSIPEKEIRRGSLLPGASAATIPQSEGKYLGAGAIAYPNPDHLLTSEEIQTTGVNKERRNSIPQKHSNFKGPFFDKLTHTSMDNTSDLEQRDNVNSKIHRGKSKDSLKSENTIRRMLQYHGKRRHSIVEDEQEFIHLSKEWNARNSLIPSNEDIMRLRRLSKLSDYENRSHRSSQTSNLASRNSSEHNQVSKTDANKKELGVAMTDLANFLQSHMNRGRFDKEMKEEDEEADAFAKSPAWRRGLILLLIGLTIICVGHIMVTIYLFMMPERYEHPYACTTPNCLRMSRWLKDAMNTEVSPCDDFYEFSCGGYIKKFASNQTSSNKSTADKLYTSGLLFDYKYHPSLGKFLKRVKTYPVNQILPFYQACMNMDKRNKLGVKPFINLLSQLKLLRIPSSNANPDSRNIARIIGRIYKKTNRLFFVNFDDLQYNFIRLKIPRPPQELLMTSTKVYEKSMRQIFTLLQKDLLIEDEKEIDTIVYLVMRFEGQLTAVQSRSATALIFGFPHRMANEIKVPENLHPNYNRFIGKFLWEDLLSELYDYNPGSYDNYTIFYNVMMSAMEDKEERYFTIFIQYLIRKTPVYTLIRFFQWNLLKIFGFDLTEDVQNIVLNIYRNQGKTVTERCFRSVFFNLHVLAAERYTQMLDNRTKRFMEMDDMVTDFKNSFTEIITEDSMNQHIPATLMYSLMKTAETLRFVHEPVDEVLKHLKQFYKGLKLNRTRHFRNVIQARTIKTRNDLLWAKHIPPFNKWTSGTYAIADVTITTSKQVSGMTMRNLHFPIATSMEPYTGNDLPLLNYAGFGYWVLAQYSLYHAMEDFFADGLKQRKESEPRFVVRRQKYIEADALNSIECVYDSYKNMESPLFPGVKNNPMTKLSRVKTVADVFGLEFFLLAMQRLKKNPKAYPKYQILPGLETYTPDQLLFMAIARHTCVESSRQNTLHFLQYGPPLFELRIKGSFRNSAYFAKTWNCPKRTYMNPTKKCKLFSSRNSPYNMSAVIQQLFNDTKDWINDPYTRAAFSLRKA